MKLTLLGSIGNIGRTLIPELIAAEHDVTVITTNPARKDAIKDMGAVPAVGDMRDVDFLTAQFTGADAVYLMISGTNNSAEGLFEAARQQAAIFRQAIENAGVKKVVDLSSIGAEAGEIAGALYAYHLIEAELRKLTDVAIAFVRPVAFYSNFFANLSSIQKQHTIFSDISSDVKHYWVDPKDIAAVILPLLENTPAGHTVHYAISDYFSYDELVAQLQQVLDMPDLQIVSITAEQYEQGLLQSGVPQSIAEQFMKMRAYQEQTEQLYADLRQQQPTLGKVKLADFAKTVAFAVHHPEDFTAQTIIENRQEK